MAQALTVEVLQTQQFIQGDARDPLGLWGFRLRVTGDATGGGIKVTAFAPRDRAGAYVYTAYGAFIAKLTGTVNSFRAKTRVLTNWPNIDPTAGVQAYGHLIVRNIQASTLFTAPIAGPDGEFIGPLTRFMLIMRPQANADDMDLIELELADNEDLATYSFEGYGYFWDRDIANIPGGPRHPGAN